MICNKAKAELIRNMTDPCIKQIFIGEFTATGLSPAFTARERAWIVRADDRGAVTIPPRLRRTLGT